LYPALEVTPRPEAIPQVEAHQTESEVISLHDIWRNLSSRVLFFTKETAYDIPEAPGVYGWFLPLWIFDTKLESFLAKINALYSYDAKCQSVAECEVQAGFNWEHLAVRLRKSYSNIVAQERVVEWDARMGDKSQKEAIAVSLMESSIFMPPLYVGKADVLKTRYEQHVQGFPRNANHFHARFTNFARKQDLNLNVSDLLFVCILSDLSVQAKLKSANANELLETVLLKLCKPVFSDR
jgi:hypothetical protein